MVGGCSERSVDTIHRDKTVKKEDRISQVKIAGIAVRFELRSYSMHYNCSNPLGGRLKDDIHTLIHMPHVTNQN